VSAFDASALDLLVRSEIPGLPPSVNHYLCRSGRNTFKTPEAREWQSGAATILMLDYRRQPVYEGDICVEVQCHTHRPRSFDADNRLKSAQDCLAQAGIIKDDRQVVWATVGKLWTDGGEYTVIEARKLPNGIPKPGVKRGEKSQGKKRLNVH
jgi:Holliday junction resolvase RusA-like endonuclease